MINNNILSFKILIFLTASFFCYSSDYLLSYSVVNKEKNIVKTLKYPYLLGQLESLVDEYIKNFDREITYLDFCNNQKNSDIFLKDYSNIFKISLSNIDYKNNEKNYQNHIQIYSDFSKYEIERFCQSEFFDVAVAFDLISLVDNDVSILSNILESAFLVFIHIPPKVKFLDPKTICILENIEKEILKRKNIKLQTEIMKIYGSSLYLVFNSNKKLKRSNFVREINKKIEYEVVANFQKVEFIKNYLEVNQIKKSSFIPGINLVTYLMLNGDLPLRDFLKKEIRRLACIPHPDFMPYNMILTKNGLQLIDFEDWRCPDKDQEEAIKASLNITPLILQLINSENKNFIKAEIEKGLKKS